MNRIIPIILAGGKGSRLWPLSTEDNPKQFIKIFNSLSLFQKTLIRNNFLSDITVITTEHYKKIVLEQSKEVNVEVFLIIEPIIKNTAASCILAAIMYQYLDNVSLLFLPADHYITDDDLYLACINKAILNIEIYNFIILGIKASNINPNYGYIKANNNLDENFYDVDTFQEKPLIDNIKLNLEEKMFWHTGIFLINIKQLLNAAQLLQPLILKHVSNGHKLGIIEDNILYISRKSYEHIKPISFDHAFLEHMMNITLMEVNFNWQDLGNWEALHEFILQSNFSSKQLLCKLIASIIINNHEEIKNNHNTNLETISNNNIIPTFFKQNDSNTDTYCREWGYFKILAENSLEEYKIKELVIYPHKKISLQSHFYREEFWVITKGQGEMIIGVGNTLHKSLIKEGDFIKINIREMHQLINSSTSEIKLIEIQKGNILIEEDIIRFNDNIYEMVK